MSPTHDPLVLAALRARMGDWTYYVSFLKLADVASRISTAQEIHKSSSLDELLQRDLTSRSGHIRDYLLGQKQRFFNALIVGTYGGSPQWNELKVQKGRPGLDPPPEALDGVLGFLSFDGSETLFAVDGQHRVAGIRQAVKARSTLGQEEICVILVPGVTQANRMKDPEGYERTRRLFSTVNRYAKPVSKKDIIALDEDDIVAITTRTLVEEHVLFRDGKVGLNQTKNMPPRDRSSFTNIITLYDVLDVVFKPPEGWAHVKRFRPTEARLKEFAAEATAFWDGLVSHFKPLKEFARSAAADQVAGKYRTSDGGNLLFRPIGLMVLAKAIRLLSAQFGLETAISRVADAPLQLAGAPWEDLLWDSGNARMIYAAENQRVAVKLLYYMAGGALAAIDTSGPKLLEEWAGILGLSASGMVLPRRRGSTGTGGDSKGKTTERAPRKR